VQKYTQQQLAGIAKVHDEVATACPDYEADVRQLLSNHAAEIPEDLVPEAIADLLAETFAEPETEDIAETNGDDETGDADDDQNCLAMKTALRKLKKTGCAKSRIAPHKQKLLDLASG